MDKERIKNYLIGQKVERNAKIFEYTELKKQLEEIQAKIVAVGDVERIQAEVNEINELIEDLDKPE